MNISNIDEAIKLFAKVNRIKPDSPEFVKCRSQILKGLGMIGLDNKSVDIDKYKTIATRKELTIGEKWDMIEAAASEPEVV